MKGKLSFLLFAALLGRATIAAEQSASQPIILASTTLAENSKLLAHILPTFTEETTAKDAESGFQH